MPQILNFLSPRVLELMRRIETEKDRDTLAQLFLELNLLINQKDENVRSGKKRNRSIDSGQERRRRA
jgi:hypothetical protein